MHGLIHLSGHRRIEFLKRLCLILGVEKREVDMLVHGNVSKSVSHLVASEKRIDDQQNWQKLRYSFL